MIKQQLARLSEYKRQREIVLNGNKESPGTPIMAIHDMRIEHLEKFLGIRK